MLMLLTKAKEVRGKLVWGRHEFSYRQAVVVATTFKGQLSSRRYETCH